MVKKVNKEFLVDTRILIEHLKKSPDEEESYLVKLMQKGMCFTTVLNAAEVFLKCKSKKEKYFAKSMLSALKVLGIPARYSLYVNEYSDKNTSLKDAFFMVTASMNKIDIITLNPKKYQSNKSAVLHPDDLY